ncbi:glycosyltransferase family 2 protein [Psychrobacter cryohalolentis]|uniref:glycosyltransferase family 2 protein n=1 Tax=Psychrobacter cryohalolentis TaxID=330922 RepID=UPI003F85F3F5
MLLSIVVPVYNSEMYIIECLDSILDQLLYNTEVIIINDASTDKSLSLIKDCINSLDEEKRKLIRLVSLEENRGVGFARMHAIKICNGDYICSIDPDDVVSRQFIKNIMIILQDYKPDIVQFQISRFYKKPRDGELLSNNFLEAGMHLMQTKTRQRFYEQSFWSFCTRIIRKELLSNIDLSILRNCEDVYALPLIFLKSQNIYILDECYYYYRLNKKSLSKNNNLTHVKNQTESYKYILDRYLNYIEKDPQLFYALIPIFRSYLNFCLIHHDSNYAKLEYSYYNEKINKSYNSNKIFNKLSHNLFIIFGLPSLYLLRFISR